MDTILKRISEALISVSNSKILLITIIVAQISALTLIINNYAIISPPKNEQKFFTVASKYLESKSASNQYNMEDMKILFNSIDRESNGQLSKYSYIFVLEDYLSFIVSNDIKEDDNYYNIVYNMLEKEKEQEPYTFLTQEEKRIMKNLESSIKLNNTNNALFNLTSLNDVLRIKNEKVKRLETQNFWSLIISILSIVFTLFFGIMSIFISKKADLNKENL